VRELGQPPTPSGTLLPLKKEGEVRLTYRKHSQGGVYATFFSKFLADMSGFTFAAACLQNNGKEFARIVSVLDALVPLFRFLLYPLEKPVEQRRFLDKEEGDGWMSRHEILDETWAIEKI
jgi:hypothetical protein